MTRRQSRHALARLQLGFNTDAVRLTELQKTFKNTVQDARQFGNAHGSPADWNEIWQKQWDDVEATLGRIHVQLNKMDSAVQVRDLDQMQAAINAWEMIQAEDAHIAEMWQRMKAQWDQISVSEAKTWETLTTQVETDLDTIHAFAQALRVRLELLKVHSKEEVDQLVHTILARLPNRSLTEASDAAQYDQEYQEAARELEAERHKYMGFIDVVKGLLLWTETTEERTAKLHSLAIQPA